MLQVEVRSSAYPAPFYNHSITMSSTDLPHIRKLNDGSHHFILHHKPFMIRAAELNNSSMTSSQYMLHGPPIAHLSTQHTKQSGVWSNLIHNHVNTVLGCVTWEQIEREEGEFDFRQLDDILLEARRHQLKLILLWFGSFKNGEISSFNHQYIIHGWFHMAYR